MLELQARCGLRIGEVLNLRASDVAGRKLIIQEPKSGRDAEVAFMPEHIITRLTYCCDQADSRRKQGISALLHNSEKHGHRARQETQRQDLTSRFEEETRAI